MVVCTLWSTPGNSDPAVWIGRLSDGGSDLVLVESAHSTFQSPAMVGSMLDMHKDMSPSTLAIWRNHVRPVGPTLNIGKVLGFDLVWHFKFDIWCIYWGLIQVYQRWPCVVGSTYTWHPKGLLVQTHYGQLYKLYIRYIRYKVGMATKHRKYSL